LPHPGQGASAGQSGALSVTAFAPTGSQAARVVPRLGCHPVFKKVEQRV